jgi:hypothetical protein
MGRFELVQRCWPTGSFRSAEVAQFLSSLARDCHLSRFETLDNRDFKATADSLELLFQAALDEAPFPAAGADVDLHGAIGETDDYVRCDFHTGTKPGQAFIDHYNVDFGESGIHITADQFRKAVQIVKPFEAFLAELNNEDSLDAYTRQQELNAFDVPAIIRSVHYFDHQMAARMGGVEHCLRAPGHRVERFLQGVLIELVDGPFEADNPAHLQAQQAVMQHLGFPIAGAPRPLPAEAGDA